MESSKVRYLSSFRLFRLLCLLPAAVAEAEQLVADAAVMAMIWQRSRGRGLRLHQCRQRLQLRMQMQRLLLKTFSIPISHRSSPGYAARSFSTARTSRLRKTSYLRRCATATRHGIESQPLRPREVSLQRIRRRLRDAARMQLLRV